MKNRKTVLALPRCGFVKKSDNHCQLVEKGSFFILSTFTAKSDNRETRESQNGFMLGNSLYTKSNISNINDIAINIVDINDINSDIDSNIINIVDIDRVRKLVRKLVRKFVQKFVRKIIKQRNEKQTSPPFRSEITSRSPLWICCSSAFKLLFY